MARAQKGGVSTEAADASLLYKDRQERVRLSRCGSSATVCARVPPPWTPEIAE
jgi:hypothetical protein